MQPCRQEEVVSVYGYWYTMSIHPDGKSCLCSMTLLQGQEGEVLV